MEDAATAEISRSQVWQWVTHGEFTADHVRDVIAEELPTGGRFGEAREIFERVALSDDFVEFLTLPAYDYID
jgi:malate synthase